ncbi:unnamed protein product [Tilletia caries]|uniref:1-phosphatidylinositol-3-phosphate 5-kinase n=2 Tax=Tilletia TaxID=13289 RepID=A0A8X7MU20_9BASI|nr:hypothetical protein CF335_g7868 [Tilletia laevis]KAE8198554.1 hypothetical protein CF328_g3517 [Tilletia controversa]KAE8261749.1 hypothetical protein A4X03_0g2993 [Tilletia caries]KAE8194360.1 hypothetical protein CF336_g3571 [Tilletia laevis]KAE8247721.1 hypothetical protein A4X06_0g4243 [Tilletia controversa]
MAAKSSRGSSSSPNLPVLASSRPPSVASCGSQSSIERILSPTLLSPALASTLVAGRSAHGTNASSPASGAGLAAKRFIAPGAIAATGRRISLPNVPSMVNRVSMVSVASIESLPEDEALGAPLPHSPTLSDSSSSVASPRSDLRRFPALPPSPRLRSSLSISDSPPTSPDLPRPHQLQHSKSTNRPKSILKRSVTEPYGMGKEFEMLMTKRRFVAMELLDTERVYMQSLKLLDEHYLKPMQLASIGQPPPSKTSAPCPQLSKKTIAEIFGNFTNIFTLNKELLAQLERRLEAQQQPAIVVESAVPARPLSVDSSGDSSGSGSDINMPSSSSSSSVTPSASSAISDATSTSTGSRIAAQAWNPRDHLVGDILVPIAPFLSMYKLFAQQFSNSLARIDAERKQNDSFAKFLRAAESAAQAGRSGSGGFGLGFESHLLTIVQRITRYKMLVGDLVKFTPEGHADRPDLVKAFNLVSQIAHDCDDNIRTHEMVLVMVDLQRSLNGLTEPLIVPGRSLLKRGALLKTCRKNIQPRQFFLFTDCIMYASPTNGGLESSASAAWQAMVGAGLASVLGADWANGSSSLAGVSRKLAGPAHHGNHGSSAGGPAVSAFGARVRTHSASAAESGTNTTSMAPVNMQTHSLQFRAKIALQDCTVVSVDMTHHYHGGSSSASVSEGLMHAFELRTPEKSFALYAESQEAKDDWMSMIREAREAHMIARQTLRAEEDSIEAKRERRRSLYKDHQKTASNAAAAVAAGKSSALRLSMPLGSSLASIAAVRGEGGGGKAFPTLREGEPFPTVDAASGDGYPSGGGGPEQQIPESSSATAVAADSVGGGGGGVSGVVIRERHRLSSLQSIASAIPSPGSLGGLLSPAMAGGPNGTQPAKPLKMVEDYNAPVWVPDNHADKCAVCWDWFGIWRRRHHCRLCGQVVCWNCSQRSFLIPAYEEGVDDQQARACDRCFESMFPPSDEDEGISFGMDPQ